MREIPLSKGKVALVSDEDYEALSKFKWYASLESRGTKWYAIRKVRVNGKQVKIRMHRVIMGLPPGKGGEPGADMVVDHKDHDSLNNTRENLEITTQEENMNRSEGWKGSRAWNVQLDEIGEFYEDSREIYQTDDGEHSQLSDAPF